MLNNTNFQEVARFSSISNISSGKIVDNYHNKLDYLLFCRHYSDLYYQLHYWFLFYFYELFFLSSSEYITFQVIVLYVFRFFANRNSTISIKIQVTIHMRNILIIAVRFFGYLIVRFIIFICQI